ncbi:MAG TPA: dTDP-4-amino-4,6-dideoxygalactose transaminase [Thermoanaerobaculia bacterium]|nr:dTDP-4-amino-4,6-dideoxygalactose transaminase [Thermoanaerobaculia bacterium]
MSLPQRIPFNRPYTTGRELEYVREAIAALHLSGNGAFTRRCQAWLEARVGCAKALLTHSCTAALEMAALLAGIAPGDEVIMPSYTFVSTANAFVLRGGVPVFVDVRPGTFNLDPGLLEAAVTPRTKALVPVHYAGVACEMEPILDVARRHGLLVIEDAAQGLLSTYQGRPLGSFGDFAAVSFHETKNVTAGEGGALLVNGDEWIERAEVLWEKGTDRGRFFRGQVDKYRWVDLGSSFLPSEINAAFLWAQLEEAEAITRERLRIWERYHEAFAGLESRGDAIRPTLPAGCVHNGHLYYLVVRDLPTRTRLLAALAEQGIQALFHYVPLHDSPAGRRFGRAQGNLPYTQMAGDRLLRLPLWPGMDDATLERVTGAVHQALNEARGEAAPAARRPAPSRRSPQRARGRRG